MFHIYDNGSRITSNPVSYNYILKYSFRNQALVDWNKISSLPEGHAYAFKEFMIVRVN